MSARAHVESWRPMYWKLPRQVVRSILRGDLEPSEALIACLLEPLKKSHKGTVAQLVRLSKLSRRAVQYALRGRSEKRRGLKRWVRYAPRLGWIWRRLDDYCRVGWDDVAGLIRCKSKDAVRAWAWALLLVSGGDCKPRALWSPADMAAELGWHPGRAWRAMNGGEGRGAVSFGLVQLSGAFLVARHPQADEEPEAASDEVTEEQEPIPPASVAAGPGLSVWQHLLRMASERLGKSAIALVDKGSHSAHRQDPTVHTPRGARARAARDLGSLYQILNHPPRSRKLVRTLLASRCKQVGLNRDDLGSTEVQKSLAAWLDRNRAWPADATWNVDTIAAVLDRFVAPELPTLAEVTLEAWGKLCREVGRLLHLFRLSGLDADEIRTIYREADRHDLESIRSAFKVLPEVAGERWDSGELTQGAAAVTWGGRLP